MDGWIDDKHLKGALGQALLCDAAQAQHTRCKAGSLGRKGSETWKSEVKFTSEDGGEISGRERGILGKGIAGKPFQRREKSAPNQIPPPNPVGCCLEKPHLFCASLPPFQGIL